MTEVEKLAAFVVEARFDSISQAARTQLLIRILDSIGCAIGAQDGEPIAPVAAQTREFGGNPLCTVIGGGMKTAPDRAAFHNGALVRYLDFMDSYLAKGETCHPSDNLAPVLAAAEYADCDGRALLTALAVAYQVEARLCDEAPVRDRGFDHTTLGAFAAGAGIAKALRLDVQRTADAVALAGVANLALRVTRTGALSQWKGLAAAHTAFAATHSGFLAMRGITGPREIFEGNKGFEEAVSGPFTVDWAHEGLDAATRTVVKKYNAEIHAQSALEAALDLRQLHGISAAAIEKVEVDIFDVAHKIIGGGEEGNKRIVCTKEQADHSLPYMLAAALCDGELEPSQYAPARITAADVQHLLCRVHVRPNVAYSERFPGAMACRVAITLADGRRLAMEKPDFEGFNTRPMTWDTVVHKFNRLSSRFAPADARRKIVDAVAALPELKVRDLAHCLAFKPCTCRR